MPMPMEPVLYAREQKERWPTLNMHSREQHENEKNYHSILNDTSNFTIFPGVYYKSNRDGSHSCISAYGNTLLEMSNDLKFDKFWNNALAHDTWKEIKYGYCKESGQHEQTAELIALKLAFEKLAAFEKNA